MFYKILLVLFLSIFSATGFTKETSSAEPDYGWVTDSWKRNDKAANLVANKTEKNRVVIKALQQIKFGDQDALNWRPLWEELKKKGLLTSEEIASGRLNSLDQKNVGSCFLKDTMILMSNGTHKPIQEIIPGDLVTSGKSTSRKVNQVFVLDHNGKMCNVKLWGHYGFKCTPDHKIMTLEGYKRADQLSKTDYVVIPRRNHLSNFDKKIDILNYIQEETLNRAFNKVPRFYDKNHNLGWMFGSFLAEGNYDHCRVCWTWNINEENTHVKTLIQILSDLKIKSRVKKMPGKNTIKVFVESKPFAEFLLQMCGEDSLNKKPSEYLLNGPSDFISGVYNGWIDGDGHRRRNEEQGKTISKHLAYSMYGIDLSLGNAPIISKQAGKPDNVVKHRYDSYQVGHQVNFNQTWHFKNETGYVARRVRDVSFFEHNGKVYDFEVDVDHSYCIEGGIHVHNCVGWSTTIAGDHTLANQAKRGKLKQQWKFRMDPATTYAIGREAGNQLGDWDGSTGAWSIRGIKNIGYFHRKKYKAFDLSRTTPSDADKWAATGVPDFYFNELVYKGEGVRAETVAEFKAALQGGLVGIVCAQASYGRTRDSLGFTRRTGRAWAHAMAVIAYRGPQSGREGFLIQNSWTKGPAWSEWNSGPVWPKDQPKGSFWVTPGDLQFHLSQNDSWIITKLDSFERKNLTAKEIFDFEGKLQP